MKVVFWVERDYWFPSLRFAKVQKETKKLYKFEASVDTGYSSQKHKEFVSEDVDSTCERFVHNLEDKVQYSEKMLRQGKARVRKIKAAVRKARKEGRLDGII